jgi:GTPase SAR1 family protein
MASFISSLFSLTSSCIKVQLLSDPNLPRNRVLFLGSSNSGKTTLVRSCFSGYPNDPEVDIQARSKETLRDCWNILAKAGCDLPVIDDEINGASIVQLKQLLQDPRFQSVAYEGGKGSALEGARFWSNQAENLLTPSTKLSKEVHMRAKVKHDECLESKVTINWSEITLIDVPEHAQNQDFLSKQRNLAGVCYVIDLDLFDQTDDSTGENLLELEMKRFHKVIKYLPNEGKELGIVLVFNKIDLLRLKLDHGIPFSMTNGRFSDFQEFTSKNAKVQIRSLESLILKYLHHKFRKAAPTSVRKQAANPICTFDTSAIEPDNFRDVFIAISASVVALQLAEAGFH